ncbi:galacturonosyltransferase 11-like, partial [Trifolium medium]|nr:galacturonosyltransferase 11-like [Trifolium medium]
MLFLATSNEIGNTVNLIVMHEKLNQISQINVFVTVDSTNILHCREAAMPVERNTNVEHFSKNRVNLTEEILCATSLSRQLSEEMVLAKAYVVIAKQHNNFHLAWELSSKIRSSQLLLSKAAMTGKPVAKEEAEPIIKSLSSLIFKAQDIHYDIATTIVTMKSHIQALEE